MTNLLTALAYSVAGAAAWKVIEYAWSRRGSVRLRAILAFDRDEELVFAYPPRPGADKPLLPRTSTEDFMAINNIISALMSLGWDSRRFMVRDTGRVTADLRQKNLIVFCSPKTNAVAETLQQELIEAGVRFCRFVQEAVDGKTQWVIHDGYGSYRSPALEAERSDGEPAGSAPLHQQRLEDYAVITKVRNPWNQAKQVLWIAGIRGIGTWGAAETVKKWHGRLLKPRLRMLLQPSRAVQFSAVVKITYSNSDIVDSELVRMIDIGAAES